MNALLVVLLVATQAPAQRQAQRPGAPAKRDTIYVAVQSPSPTVNVAAPSQGPTVVLGILGALVGFALGSAQSLTVDWIRHRSRHRTQLRLLRAELRRLVGFSRKWNYVHGVVPPDDATPNPPTITPSYEKLLQDVDFWLTDEHSDDNTQQGLIDIADGARVLQRYDAAARDHIERATATSSPKEKRKHYTRAVDNTQVYDKELDRWHTMVGSALLDAERRLGLAGIRRQLVRVFRPLRKGTNPPALQPIDHA